MINYEKMFNENQIEYLKYYIRKTTGCMAKEIRTFIDMGNNGTYIVRYKVKKDGENIEDEISLESQTIEHIVKMYGEKSCSPSSRASILVEKIKQVDIINNEIHKIFNNLSLYEVLQNFNYLKNNVYSKLTNDHLYNRIMLLSKTDVILFDHNQRAVYYKNTYDNSSFGRIYLAVEDNNSSADAGKFIQLIEDAIEYYNINTDETYSNAFKKKITILKFDDIINFSKLYAIKSVDGE